MIEKALDADGEPSPAERDDADEALQLPQARRLPADAPLAGAADAAAEGGTDGTEAVARPLGLRIEALLFASGQPLGPAKLAHALGAEQAAVSAALAELTALWRSREGAVDLVEIAGGFRFMTRPEFAGDVAALQKKVGAEKLSPAALETLAVVAYRQPITRADVESVRGVGVGPLLRLLLERDLIKIAGRASEPGNPLLYGTTKRFLDHFGLASLAALPDLKDLLETP